MSGVMRAEIEGYAALFGEPDLSGDVIGKGAFSQQLIPAHRPPVRMLYQHKAECPIGVWNEIREDHRGLLVRGAIFLDSARGSEVHGLLHGGAIDGLSIGFKPKRSFRRKGGRLITEAELWEVSIVTFPMAPAARVTRVGGPGEHLPRNLLSA
jgi:HK97 family phage prohead protease